MTNYSDLPDDFADEFKKLAKPVTPPAAEHPFFPPEDRQWQKLFKLADEIFTMKPREVLKNSELLIIHPPKEKPILYVSFTAFDDMEDIAIFEGNDGLTSFYHTFQTGSTARQLDRAVDQMRFLVCLDHKRINTAWDKEQRLIMPGGLESDGTIMFTRAFPGFVPYTVSGKEANRLIRQLKITLEAICTAKSLDKRVPHSPIHCFTYFDNGKDAPTTIGTTDIAKIYAKASRICEDRLVPDDISLTRWKNDLKDAKPSKYSTYELDVRHVDSLMFPDMYHTDGRPWFPKCMVLCDHDTGRRISDMLIFDIKNEIASIRNRLAEAFCRPEIGIPKEKIIVMDEYIGKVIAPICEIVGIDCESSQVPLKNIERVYEAIDDGI